MATATELKATARHWQSVANNYRAQRDDAEARAAKYSRFVGFAYGVGLPFVFVAGGLVGWALGVSW